MSEFLQISDVARHFALIADMVAGCEAYDAGLRALRPGIDACDDEKTFGADEYAQRFFESGDSGWRHVVPTGHGPMPFNEAVKEACWRSGPQGVGIAVDVQAASERIVWEDERNAQLFGGSSRPAG